MGRSNALIILVLPVLVALAVVFSSNLSALFAGPQAGPTTGAATPTAAPASSPAEPVKSTITVKPPTSQAPVAPSEVAVPTQPLVPKPAPRAPSVRAAPSPSVSAAPPVAPTRTAPPVAAKPAQAPTSPYLIRGRALATLLYDNQLDRLWRAFSPQTQTQWGGLAAFKAYRAGGLNAYGTETKVLRERVVGGGGLTYYTRTSQFERGSKGGWTLILGLTKDGQVRQFGIVAAGALPDKTRR